MLVRILEAGFERANDDEFISLDGASKISRTALVRAVQGGDWRTAQAFGVKWAERKPIPEGKMALPGTERFELISGKVWLVCDHADLPVERRMLPKWLVADRLTDTQLEAAFAIMSVRQQQRWWAQEFPNIYADDPDMLSVLAAIGADPSVVLAEGDA